MSPTSARIRTGRRLTRAPTSRHVIALDSAQARIAAVMARLVALIVRDTLAVHIWLFGAASGGSERLGHGGSELGDVHRAGGIDHDNGTEPQRAGWLTP